ncbi:MAG: TRAP transporter TatT component family protein [Congregibacter sp.]|nr:TRAP transporter TatT component family protein [Congregibacter sp.]
MLKQIVVALLLYPLTALSQAGALEDIQRDWAVANYELNGDAQKSALETLVTTTEAAINASGKNDASLLIWDGIVKSTLAGKQGGFGALSLVKASRKSLERALKLDPDALDGSAYTSLGALYYQVPGWPVGFGDDKKARELLEKAISINPDGIDSNYFYADFLIQQKELPGARRALEHALQAPARPDRPVADKGRRAEIQTLLESISD